MFLLKVVVYTALLIELATIFMRFVFKVSSKEIYIKIMRKFKLKRFYHFHHLFLGMIIALFFYFYRHETLFNVGLGIISSDLLHHFAVLWLIMGNPEFHIVYKNIGLFKREKLIEQKRIKSVMGHLIKEINGVEFYPAMLANIPKPPKINIRRRGRRKR
ncbi:hypothetical protein A3K73_08270 [Candidatus Pacearchaeota archaeon RBG_13_36_9]|nr:MAG: hypothetical protein A3K73_08270 [Candidatus Pacearchaeota archaeon RBG_13_36_9]